MLVISRKSLSNGTVTIIWLTTAFLIGYVYARLSRDEYARRRAYQRYTNAMLIFDAFSRVYEYHYGKFIDFMSDFDHTYYLWKMRTQKWAEWRAKRSLEKEIMEKQSENDEVSQIIMQLDNVSEDAAIVDHK